MPRTETELNEGWESAQEECGEERFRSVRLPHDWAIGLPFDREMKENGQQGCRDRFGVGWYRRTLFLEEKGREFFIIWNSAASVKTAPSGSTGRRPGA